MIKIMKARSSSKDSHRKQVTQRANSQSGDKRPGSAPLSRLPNFVNMTDSAAYTSQRLLSSSDPVVDYIIQDRNISFAGHMPRKKYTLGI